jgi:hypothetical protein
VRKGGSCPGAESGDSDVETACSDRILSVK